jgi:conserved hypothetical protein
MLMGVTFFLLFRDQDLAEVWQVVRDANGVWIWIAAISMGVYVFCGGYSIRVLMMGRGSKVTIPQCFEYSFMEIFFSAITPSSTGGQPVQLRAMTKDGHPVSDSTGALIAITLLYKLSFLWLCGLFFLIEFTYVGATMRSVRWLAVLGLFLNVSLISFLIIVLFSRRLTNALIRLAVRILGKLHFVKNVPEMMDRAQEKLEQYHECSQFFRRNPKQIMRTFGVLTVQRLAILIIPFCIYKSFGMTGQNLFHVVATQLIVNLCCDMMPIPGAMGISEAIFLSLFGPIFSERNLYPAVLLSRGISFYFLLAVSGVAILLFKVVKTIRRRH